MSESKKLLESAIDSFSIETFSRFFREKSRQFVLIKANFHQQNFDVNDFENGQVIGEIRFSVDESLIICSFKVKNELIERSGKKAQYEVAKNILKSPENQKFSAGIFIFYDSNGSFRFSLVYPEAIGTKRQWSNFRRFTYFVSRDLTNKTFKQRIGDGDFSCLAKLKDAFSVEKVTKEFYESIANWYFWAVEHSRFPKDAEAEENGRNIAVIRLITRMIFIWFMRERGLVPKALFKEEDIAQILKSTSGEDTTYYTGILQNLFFATLSTKKEERQFGSEIRGFKGHNPDFGNQYVFRYHELFQKPENLKNFFDRIPFLNGGLFECQDDKVNDIIIDGFTRIKKNQPIIPNFLFFSQEQNANLNKIYNTKNEIYKVRGLLDILSSFNFTIDENEPNDADVALDPELLGRVFENLLASFNPETSTTARKATGSFYTPREIVDYMVSESLKAYFKSHLIDLDQVEEKLDSLLSTENHANPFDKSQSKKIVDLIEKVKIVDPAVGSGAFPMGALNKLVLILNKVDPGNDFWKQAQLKIANLIPDKNLKTNTIREIETYFQTKKPDYWRKLFLIQKCIYGVDIQQIAVEIAKLRFFISLLVDEDINDIQPLPNLDFKIMQGNSLLEEYEDIKLFDAHSFSVDIKNQKLLSSAKARQAALQSEALKLKEEPEKKAEVLIELDKLNNQIKKRLSQNYIKERNELIKDGNMFETEIEARPKNELLKKLHKDFFDTFEKSEKIALKRQIELMEWELIESTLIENGKESELARLMKFKRSKTRPFFLWQLNFPEVFDQEGFDIVIGNPPYVRHRDIEKKLKKKLEQTFSTGTTTADIYCYFFELGYIVLKPKGILAFITSNKWMHSDYGKKLRKFIIDNVSVLNVINFKEQVFESATVDTSITLFAKDKNNTKNIILYSNGLPSEKILINKMTQTDLNQNAFNFQNKTFYSLRLKLEEKGLPLKNWQIKINYGILTGCNETKDENGNKIGVFILSKKEKDMLVLNEPNAIEIIKPILKGKDINKYSYAFNERYILLVNNKFNEKIDKYPSIKAHLSKFETILKKRAQVIREDHHWLELDQNPSDNFINEFSEEKIIFPIISQGPKFTLDKNGLYHNDKAFHIIGKNLKYLLGYLNSKLAFWCIKQYGPPLGLNGFEFRKIFIEQLPVPEVNKSNLVSINKIEKIVDKILAIKKQDQNADINQFEAEIDFLAYQLNELTSDEISIIEGK